MEGDHHGSRLDVLFAGGGFLSFLCGYVTHRSACSLVAFRDSCPHCIVVGPCPIPDLCDGVRLAIAPTLRRQYGIEKSDESHNELGG